MKKLFSLCLKPHLRNFIISIVAILLECALETTLPFLMNNMVKHGVFEESNSYSVDYNYVLTIGIIMISLGIVAFFLGVISAKFTAKACRGFGYEIRKQEYIKISEYSFKNIEHFEQSSLITRLTTDVQIISDSLAGSLRQALRAPLSAIFSLAFLISISPLLSLVFIIALLILGLSMFLIIKYVKVKFRIIQKLVDKINQKTQECIIGIKTIKALVKEDYESIKFEEINKELKDTSKKTFKINALAMPFGHFANYFAIVGILYFGGLLYITKENVLQLEDIQTFLTYVMMLLATVMMFSNVILAINRSSASIYRVNEVFSLSSEISDNKSKTYINGGSIEFKHVNFSYNNDSNYVLNNISFSIKEGQKVGIFGPTGSSKTTVISLLNRFYDIKEGEILIDNKNIKDYSLYSLHQAIGMYFQNPILVKDSIKNNIKWGNKDASDEDIILVTKIAEAYDFITNDLENGFDTILSEGGTNVSGGQRQRICLARALLKRPKILVLDDAFSALDKLTEAKIILNLKKYMPNTTVIIISSKISTIKNLDKIMIFDKGKLIDEGNHSELIKINDLYKEINFLQNNEIS